MGITTFKDIIAWQLAHELTLEVYRVVAEFPDFEKFGFANQLRRAVVSVPSNIAEGFKRKGVDDGVRMYNIAEASLEEVKYQLLLSKDLHYITDDEYQKIHEKCESVGRTLNGWIKNHY